MARSEFSRPQQQKPPTLDDIVEGHRDKVNAALRQLMASNTKLGEAASGSVTQGGKRIRPVVALLACEAVCGSHERAMPIAIAYELAHGASLTQDDIVDESATRRGAPTVQNKYGVTTAILVSDLVLFKIFEVLGTYGTVSLSKTRLASLLTHLGAAARQAVEGEFLEAAMAAKEHPTEADYVNAAGLKTGSLFAAAAASGAIVANANRKTVNNFYEYGYNMGVCFQIVDDILDFVGDSSQTGKPILKDLQNDATNIVIIHALSNADPYQRNKINAMMWKKSYGVGDIRAAQELFEEIGSLRHAAELSVKHASISRKCLEGLPDSDAKEKLEKLTRVLEVRKR